MRAADADGSVANLQFYADGTLLGQDTTSPYSFLWASPPEGVYLLTAVATDNRGMATKSEPVHIKVAEQPERTIVTVTAPDPKASEGLLLLTNDGGLDALRAAVGADFIIIFRRCENARFTILANVLRCSSGSNDFARRTSATQAESTSGAGKKQLAGILNESCSS